MLKAAIPRATTLLKPLDIKSFPAVIQRAAAPYQAMQSAMGLNLPGDGSFYYNPFIEPIKPVEEKVVSGDITSLPGC